MKILTQMGGRIRAIWTIYNFMYPHHYNQIKDKIHLWNPELKILWKKELQPQLERKVSSSLVSNNE